MGVVHFLTLLANGRVEKRPLFALSCIVEAARSTMGGTCQSRRSDAQHRLHNPWPPLAACIARDRDRHGWETAMTWQVRPTRMAGHFPMLPNRGSGGRHPRSLDSVKP